MSNDNPFDTGGFDNPFGTPEVYNPFTESKPSSSKPVTLDEFSFSAPQQSQAKTNASSAVQSNAFLSAITLDEDDSRPKIVISTGDDEPEEDDPNKPEPSRFSIEYYQRFFALDTMEFLWRCLYSMAPFKLDLIQFVRLKPDLYGPFWIATTMAFLYAFSSNLSTYLRVAYHYGDVAEWRYNIFVLTVGAPVIYLYVFGVPVGYWLYFRCFGDVDLGLVQLWSIYGYSIFVFLPIAFFNLCPSHPVQYAFMGVALVMSTAFLIINMYFGLKEKMRIGVFVMLSQLICSIIFVMSMQLIYYQFPNSFLPPITLAPSTWAPTIAAPVS